MNWFSMTLDDVKNKLNTDIDKGLKADEVVIEKEEFFIERDDVIIGIFPHKLGKSSNYTALIGMDLLERSKSNELVTNFKG